MTYAIRVAHILVITIVLLACQNPQGAPQPSVAEPTSTSSNAHNATGTPEPADNAGATMKIRLLAGDEEYIATLEDTAVARDFASMLPLDLSMRDYAKTEKIADLPRKLSLDGASDGVDPEVGDLTYFAPWGNIAIFYKDFDYASGLVRLGALDAGVEKLADAGEGALRIELVP